jgi:hypothetical protein
VDDMAWHPGQIYEAWGEIHRALHEAMTPLPPEMLAFLAERASDRIIRDKAAEVLDRLDSLDGEDGDALRRLFRKETKGVGQPESDGSEPPGLEQAVAFAKANQQVAVWDRAERPWAIALYDSVTKKLRPLSDQEAARLLNSDPLIGREWRRWNAMTGNQGSLVVVDGERVRRILSEAHEEPEGDVDTAEPA